MTTPLRSLAALALAAAASAAAAQETPAEGAAASTDWRVYSETDPTECFAVSEPTAQENTRDGQPVTVTRGETLLFVFFRPSEGANGQVSFTGGYPFAPGSTVQLEVGGTTFSFVTFEETAEEPDRDEWAWPATPEEDARVVAALRSGSQAVLSGQSARGTQTRDTFSLLGFSSAVDEAGSRCQS